jgi:hypothetical protein
VAGQRIWRQPGRRQTTKAQRAGYIPRILSDYSNNPIQAEIQSLSFEKVAPRATAYVDPITYINVVLLFQTKTYGGVRYARMYHVLIVPLKAVSHTGPPAACYSRGEPRRHSSIATAPRHVVMLLSEGAAGREALLNSELDRA